jgi:hypothetical protein
MRHDAKIAPSTGTETAIREWQGRSRILTNFLIILTAPIGLTARID